MIPFSKFHGAGNDFIMIDNRDKKVADAVKEKLAQKWCERRFGVGSDGIIFIENNPDHDFEMDFLNPDGSRSFCGNGSRCAVAFAKQLGICQNDLTFLAVDGSHQAKIVGNQVQIQMGKVNGVETKNQDMILHTGSPHYIIFSTDIEEVNIIPEAHNIRYSQEYKTDGINVNFVQELGEGAIAIRTYERGVENETLACGTGATAAALAYVAKKEIHVDEVQVKARGGDLSVNLKTDDFNQFHEIWLNGPAEFVFKGVLNG